VTLQVSGSRTSTQYWNKFRSMLLELI
jgi:hypothetical protein